MDATEIWRICCSMPQGKENDASRSGPQKLNVTDKAISRWERSGISRYQYH